MNDRKLRVKCTDGGILETSQAVLELFETLKDMLEDLVEIRGEIFVPGIEYTIMEKVIRYGEYLLSQLSRCSSNLTTGSLGKIKDHYTTKCSGGREDLFIYNHDSFETAFFSHLDFLEVFGVANAANFLNSKRLIDASCAWIAKNYFKDKTPQELHTRFALLESEKLSPQEEAELRQELGWDVRLVIDNSAEPHEQKFKVDESEARDLWMEFM